MSLVNSNKIMKHFIFVFLVLQCVLMVVQSGGGGGGSCGSPRGLGETCDHSCKRCGAKLACKVDNYIDGNPNYLCKTAFNVYGDSAVSEVFDKLYEFGEDKW